jgi:rubrerythrin
MNLNNILNEAAKAEPEVFEKTSPRRDMLRNLGKGLALSAVPVAVSSVLNKAYGQSSSGIVEVLNFALILEYLEEQFYEIGLATANLITAAEDIAAIAAIHQHELEHVNALKNTIGRLGGTPVDRPQFDFTGGGRYPNVFNDIGTFLAVAQALEDLGVRAYKGQAGNLIADNEVLTAALNIHSVEARHAAHIRRMRKALHADVKPWITGKNTGITGNAGTELEACYEGEQQISHFGVTILSITNPESIAISNNAATEAFDEPLTRPQVEAIVSQFIFVIP